MGGPTEGSREYYRGGVVSFLTPKCPGYSPRESQGVWLVLGLYHRDSHTQGSRCSARSPMEVRMSRETP